MAEQNGKIWHCAVVIKVKYHFVMMTRCTPRASNKIVWMYTIQQGFRGKTAADPVCWRKGLQ
jgi:hypothetical protein